MNDVVKKFLEDRISEHLNEYGVISINDIDSFFDGSEPEAVKRAIENSRLQFAGES